MVDSQQTFQVFCRTLKGQLRLLEIRALSLEKAQAYIAKEGIIEISTAIKEPIKEPVLICLKGGNNA